MCIIIFFFFLSKQRGLKLQQGASGGVIEWKVN
mgnify:CR=1 FL=1